jgi:HK97 family phage major capsid protein
VKSLTIPAGVTALRSLLHDEESWQRTSNALFLAGLPTNDRPRTIEEFEVRQAQIRTALTELDSAFAGQIMPEAQRKSWNDYNEELEENEDIIKELRARADRLKNINDGGGSSERGATFHTTRDSGPTNIYDVWAIRNWARSPAEESSKLRDNVLRALEDKNTTFPHPEVSRERAQEHIAGLLEKFRDADVELGSDQADFLARRILSTGSPEYKRAFGKSLMGRPLTNEEQRALSTAGSGGGFAVPFTLDPTIIPTSNHSVNPYRNIARVESIATTTWQGVSSAGVSVSYKAQAAQMTDDSPTLAQPDATPVRCDAFIPYSVEIGQDWGSLQSDIAVMIQDGKDDVEAQKFTDGDGSDEPSGFLTGATTVVTGAGSATFAVADIYKVWENLPARFRARAQWVGNLSVYDLTRQFDTAGGANIFVQNLQLGFQNQVPTPGNLGAQLLGRPANECSAMASGIATGNLILAVGDWRYFLIVDRVGMDIELVPHLFGTSGRPTGQRGIVAFWRNTSVVLSPNAFRVLKVK